MITCPQIFRRTRGGCEMLTGTETIPAAIPTRSSIRDTLLTMNRRTCLSILASGIALQAAPRWPDKMRTSIFRYLESLRRESRGYGWRGDVTAQVTPSFAAVGCYRVLGSRPPEAKRVADFVRENYPVAERRRTERPLWRLDFEQVQTLAWLDEPLESFRPLASTWTKPADFTTNYELGGNPVFQHQAMAVRARKMLGIAPPDPDGTWAAYFHARRRPNGTFNNTPAADESDGHVMNTLWGLLACDCLGVEAPHTEELTSWVIRCQRPSGGFTYSPDDGPGRVDDLAYTWAAVQILARAGRKPAAVGSCSGWISTLLTDEGGYEDRPGGEANPLATFYALDTLRMLDDAPREHVKPRSTSRALPIGGAMNVYTAQVEAPGNGSPREAVLLAKTLGIHLWTAKNSPGGWVEEARRVAKLEGVAVDFHRGDEEYGTYVELPGLGCYSHLVDTVAPHGKDTGKQLPKTKFPYPWEEFRDSRIAELRKGGGRLVWQFNENEELTRILLDEAVEKGTYSAIAAFHFGNENFLHSQPFLHRWDGRLAFVGLQDAHGKESWWWSKYLMAFRTLYLARDASWESWLDALENQRVITVRHDAVTGGETHIAGGTPELRELIFRRQAEWKWWGEDALNRTPPGSLVALRPGLPFEAGAPQEGIALRLRLAADTTNQGVPKQDLAELLAFRIDGNPATMERKESASDRYHHLELPDLPGTHIAEAELKDLSTGRQTTISATWTT